MIGHLRRQVELLPRGQTTFARVVRVRVDARGIDHRERVQKVLAPALIAHQQAERLLAPRRRADVIALEHPAPADLHHLRVRVQPVLQGIQRARGLQVGLDEFHARRECLGVRRRPAAVLQLLRRRWPHVHAPRREHAYVAPRDRVRTDLALFEQVNVEALIEGGERGLDADRAGADDGERVACGLGHQVLGESGGGDGRSHDSASTCTSAAA